MVYLYLTFFVFFAFVVFQTLYIIVPLFKNDDKNRKKIWKHFSFSVIVPAFNEERVIEDCISGFLQLSYGDAELIIINDGSTDNTLTLLKSTLDLIKYNEKVPNPRLEHEEIRSVYRSKMFANIFVIDKLNGGKADALNAGINFSQNEIVITLDADTVLDNLSLAEMNVVFQEDRVIACGGNVLIGQGFERDVVSLNPTFKVKGIIKYQFLQYLTAFYLHKRAQATFNSITVIAGAFGAFRRNVLFEIDGFRKTIGEDMDITLKLHKWIKKNGGNEKITFAPNALCYTECPSSLKNLFKQRVRWQKAFIDCLIHYRACFFRKFSKRFSIFFLIDQFVIGTLNAFPVIVTPIVLFFYNGHIILLLLFGFGAVFLFMYQSLTTIYISHLHGIKFSNVDLVRIILFLPIEILVFRMINLSFVVYGTLTYFYRPQSWNKVERSGSFGTIKVEGT